MKYVGLTKIGGRTARRNGWFDSPIETFAKELCSESGTAKGYQDTFSRQGAAAETKLQGLRSMNPSPERDRLIAEFQRIKDAARKWSNYIYEVQMMGVDMGLEECKNFFLGPIPARRNPAPAAGAVAPATLVYAGAAVVSLAILAKIVSDLAEASMGATKGYNDLVAAQIEITEDLCKKAESDPAYADACLKAMEKLQELPDQAPPSGILSQVLPYALLGLAALVGYRVLVNRLSRPSDF
jgi:hypothetical protein